MKLNTFILILFKLSLFLRSKAKNNQEHNSLELDAKIVELNKKMNSIQQNINKQSEIMSMILAKINNKN